MKKPTDIKKGLSESSDAHLESLELCALIESIPLWRVVDEVKISMSDKKLLIYFLLKYYL